MPRVHSASIRAASIRAASIRAAATGDQIGSCSSFSIELKGKLEEGTPESPQESSAAVLAAVNGGTPSPFNHDNKEKALLQLDFR